MPKHINGSDLQGAGCLTIDGINGIIALVEAMHHTINRLGGLLGKSNQNRTTGITGMVYRHIRSVSGLAGGATELLLKRLSPLLRETGSSILWAILTAERACHYCPQHGGARFSKCLPLWKSSQPFLVKSSKKNYFFRHPPFGRTVGACWQLD